MNIPRLEQNGDMLTATNELVYFKQLIRSCFDSVGHRAEIHFAHRGNELKDCRDQLK